MKPLLIGNWLGGLLVVAAVGCGSREPAASVASTDSDSVAAESVAAESVAAESVAAESVARESVATQAAGTAATGSGSVTFNRDIAPLVFRSCSRCHRPGEAAPFSLLTYEDLRERLQQVVEVTGSRYMPPWMPTESAHPLIGDRRLRPQEIALFARWQQLGAPQGDPGDLPPTPSWATGWQLGEPDLVVRMEETYQLRPEGPDAFREFVLPVGLDRVRYVEAIELRPGNKRIVHHANFVIDRTDSSRQLDAQDPGPGFFGMDIMGNAEHPPGHLVTWVPGTVADPHPAGTAWRLAPGTDLVLQFHMFPSGKPEPIQPVVGLHFTDEPQDSRPLQIFLLENRDIDIPPGASDYVLTQSLTLPLPVELIGLYPHMHYLGKEALVRATLPDGSEQTLLRIPNWDFNWQDVYTFAEPVRLLAGTQLSFRYVFDNSTDNVLNPSDPPIRVRGGNRSADEMCQLWVQVRVADEAARDQLLTAVNEHNVRAFPEDLRSQIRHGVALMRSGKVEQAGQHYQKLREAFPHHSHIEMGLGYVWAAQGAADQALQAFQRAVELDSTNVEARMRLAGLLIQAGDAVAARQHLQQVVQQRPDSPAAYLELGNLEQLSGNWEAAISQYQRALEFDPENYDALNNLGTLAKNRRDLPAAVEYFRSAIRVGGNRHDGHLNLAAVYLMLSQLEDARRHFGTASELRPDDPNSKYGLGLVFLRQGELDRAQEVMQQVLETAPAYTPALQTLAELAERQGDRSTALSFLQRVQEAMPEDPLARCRRASFHLRAGELEQAEREFAAALELRPETPLAHAGLAEIEFQRRNWQQAETHYRQALRSPQVPLSAAANLAWLLSTCPDASIRNGEEAVQTIERCLRFVGRKNPSMLDKLAAAQAEAGLFAAAVETAGEALRLARQAGQQPLANAIEQRLALYRQQQPYRLAAESE